MARHSKLGTRPVSIEITPEQRQELLLLTGEKTLTASVDQALREYIAIQERVVTTVSPEKLNG